jgi:hypothetical protein
MSVTCRGKKDGRYQILESDPHVLLVFGGPDADEFQQINPPVATDPETRCLPFELEVGLLNETAPGFLTEESRGSGAFGGWSVVVRLSSRPVP